jgi:hypothetical protein
MGKKCTIKEGRRLKYKRYKGRRRVRDLDMRVSSP